MTAEPEGASVSLSVRCCCRNPGAPTQAIAVAMMSLPWLLLLLARRRPASGVANPRGGDNPYRSPDGHNIVDVRFYEGMKLFGEDAPVSCSVVMSIACCVLVSRL